MSAVTPTVVITGTPLHDKDSHEFLKSLQPSGQLGSVQDIVDAVPYLTDASFTAGVW